MKEQQAVHEEEYRAAMGRLLVMYTQVDYLIMRACAERIATAPDDETRMMLGKQVGDESRHVRIQQQWIREFGVDRSPVFSDAQQAMFLEHFRELDWLDFLTDMYVCVEALGSEAVEQIVPIADPGTRASLATPLQDEVDHVAFGIGCLKRKLAGMSESRRSEYLASVPSRIDFLDDTLHGLGVDMRALFSAAGADYDEILSHVLARREQLLHEISLPLAA